MLVILALPWRWPGCFAAACVCGGAATAIKFLRDTCWESVSLGLLGGLAAAAVAGLYLSLARRARERAEQESLLEEMLKSRQEADEKFRNGLTDFWEQCVEEEGDTPVWKDNEP